MAGTPRPGPLTTAPPPPGRITGPRRLVYLGSPVAAVAPLQALVAAGHEVVLVVSRPDRRRGRGAAVSPSPVKAAAVELGLAVSDEVDDVLRAGADLGVVVAYGQILRAPVLAALPLVNLHFSLLPRWRGAAPVERAILAGDVETGVCVMRVEAGLDTGPVLARATVPIGAEQTADELRAELSAVGARLLVGIVCGELGPGEPQRGEATYAAKLEVAELRLDWERPAVELARQVRVGGAWSTFRGRRLKVHRAAVATDAGGEPPGTLTGTAVATGEGALVLGSVQTEGRPVVEAEAWVRGSRPAPGEVLGR